MYTIHVSDAVPVTSGEYCNLEISATTKVLWEQRHCDYLTVTGANKNEAKPKENRDFVHASKGLSQLGI